MVSGQCEVVSSRVEPQPEDLSMQGDGYTSVHEGSAEGGSAHGAQQYRRSQSAGTLRRSRSASKNPGVQTPEACQGAVHLWAASRDPTKMSLPYYNRKPTYLQSLSRRSAVSIAALRSSDKSAGGHSCRTFQRLGPLPRLVDPA